MPKVTHSLQSVFVILEISNKEISFVAAGRRLPNVGGWQSAALRHPPSASCRPPSADGRPPATSRQELVTWQPPAGGHRPLAAGRWPPFAKLAAGYCPPSTAGRWLPLAADSRQPLAAAGQKSQAASPAVFSLAHVSEGDHCLALRPAQ